MNKNYFLLLISIIVASCTTDVGNFQIGEDLVEAKSSIVMIDSFSVKLSTVLLDSLPTSDPELALIGRFKNPTTGTTEIQHFLNFDIDGNASLIDEDDIFDSITVKFSYSGYSIGDTTQLQNFSLHRLKNQLELIEDDESLEYLFNTSDFEYETDPIGQYQFMPYPSTDSIEFRISDELGEEFISLIVDDADEVSTAAKFRTYLKGFILKSAGESKAIIGFTSDTSGIELNLYTHRLGFELEEKVYHFPISSDGTNFNKVISDRTGTDYTVLKNQKEEIPATETSNLTFIQGSSGVVTRIDFPTLNEIYTYSDRVLIKAELILVPSVVNDENNIPDILHFYTTDRINRFGDNLTIETTNGTATSVEANLVLDLLYHENSYYIANITQFMLDELAGNFYDSNDGLIVTFPSSDLLNKADLLILNGEKVTGFSPKLKLYFLKYE